MKNFFFLWLAFCLAMNIQAQTWTEVQKIFGDEIISSSFGRSVDISGNYVIVGAPYDGEDEFNEAGGAFIFERAENGIWSKPQKIVPSDRAEGIGFGVSVSISGDYAIVGASRVDSAYIFERGTEGIWTEVQKLEAADKEAGDIFGLSVSISGDYAIVSAYGEDEDVSGGHTLEDAGAAYIFERDVDGTWTEVQKIVASDRKTKAEFGWRLSMDGDYAIIGSRDENLTDENILQDTGSVYFFERNVGGIWEEVQKIVASDRNKGDLFGVSVDISGNYAIVGATDEDEDSNGENTLDYAGSAYIFERGEAGTWTEVQKIVASDREEGAYFGIGVSISGNIALVGATYEDEGISGEYPLLDAGAAYIFEKGEDGTWTEVQKIVASNRNGYGNFGWEVGLSGEHAILTGTYWEQNPPDYILENFSLAYIFELCTPATPSSPTLCGLSSVQLVAGDTLMLNGANFSHTLGENIVKIGTTPGEIIDASDTQLSVIIPALAPGIYQVTVEVGGEVSNAKSFELKERNHFPEVTNDMEDQIVYLALPFTFTLPANLFTDPDGDALTYTAIFDNGLPLPDWIVFDTATLSFNGMVPDGPPFNIRIKVTATDEEGASAFTYFFLIVEEEVTGTEDKISRQIRIFPNPAHDRLYIEATGGLKIGALTVLDVTGRKIVQSTRTPLDISGLSEGMYLIMIEGKNFLHKERWIKER